MERVVMFQDHFFKSLLQLFHIGGSGEVVGVM